MRSRSSVPCYNKSNQVRIKRSRSSVPCYNKSNSNAQSPKLIYSAQGPEPKNQVRIVRSRSSVPCYNKSRRDSSTYSSQPRPGPSRKSARHRAGAKPLSRDLLEAICFRRRLDKATSPGE